MPFSIDRIVPWGRNLTEYQAMFGLGEAAIGCCVCDGSSPLTQVATGSYFRSMRSVGLKMLNNRLSEYVRLAAAGETVLVRDRDRVVAEIVPPRAERSPILADALLADAVRKGWLTLAAAPGSGPPSTPPPVMTLERLLNTLDEVKSDR